VCRHLAWLGGARSLSQLLLEPPHGLLVQSYAPRRQAHGRMNADGWGVGFYAPGSGAAGNAGPARWRSNRPLWGDASFASVARVIESSCVLAAVRSATIGMPLDETAVAPFTDGHWLLSHNGVVDRSVLGPHPAAESVCDSALLAAHLFEFGPEEVGRFVRDLGKRDPNARLNLLLTDGQRILATRWHDTLSVLHTDDGVVVASEPYDDDPRWADVADHHLVEVTDGQVTSTDLEA
jgi:gamma-glutamyl hercynylcysteine S-oxide hydrolase